MRATILLTSFLPWLTLLASCSAPPQPPGVDGSSRRPANSAQAVELQNCKIHLQDAHAAALESRRAAEQDLAGLSARVHAMEQALARVASEAQSAEAGASPESSAQAQHPAETKAKAQAQAAGNRVLTVRFDFGSSRLSLPSNIAQMLIEAAKTAPLVVLRGRTDGTLDTAVENRIARERATAMRDYLVAAGVDAVRIRSTYQTVGDHVADNSTEAGRALNRRVEVEIYPSIPGALGSTLQERPTASSRPLEAR